MANSKTRFIMRDFKCPVCGLKMAAPKAVHKKQTGKGHIKTMFCPNCKEERGFIQYE